MKPPPYVGRHRAPEPHRHTAPLVINGLAHCPCGYIERTDTTKENA